LVVGTIAAIAGKIRLRNDPLMCRMGF